MPLLAALLSSVLLAPAECVGPPDGSAQDDSPRCVTPAGGFCASATPDGGQVVFARADGAETNLYVAPVEGGTPRRLTSEGGDSPCVSPDGQWVAFLARRSGLSKLYLIRLTGADEHPLDHEKTWDTAPTWWPDGKAVVYATVSKRKRGIYRTDITTGKSVQLHPSGSSPAVSPDGKRLAFVENDRAANGREIWLKDLPNGKPRKLLGDLGAPQGGYFDPAWAATGEQLFFAVMQMQPSSDIGWADVASGRSMLLTKDQMGNRHPRLAASDGFVLFTSRRGEAKSECVWALSLIR